MPNKNPPVPKKILGFIFHFGYVESGRVSPLIIRYQYSKGFKSLKTALKNFTHYLFEDYVENFTEGKPTVDGFYGYILDIPSMTASSGPSFDTTHVNCEEWWVWDGVKDLIPWFKYFVEVHQCSENILINMLDTDKVLKIVNEHPHEYFRKHYLEKLDVNWHKDFVSELEEFKESYKMTDKDIMRCIDIG